MTYRIIATLVFLKDLEYDEIEKVTFSLCEYSCGKSIGFTYAANVKPEHSTPLSFGDNLSRKSFIVSNNLLDLGADDIIFVNDGEFSEKFHALFRLVSRIFEVKDIQLCTLLIYENAPEEVVDIECRINEFVEQCSLLVKRSNYFFPNVKFSLTPPS